MQKTEITTGKLIKTRKYTPKMLDFVDETFHQVSFPVPPVIIGPSLFGPWVGWNDRFCPTLNNNIEKLLGSIAPISNQPFKVKVFDQRHRLGDVVTLPGGQPQPQGVTQTIDNDVNFGAKTATATSQGLLSLPTTFFGRRQRKDEPGQWCYRSWRFPNQDHRQSEPTCGPRRRDRTSGHTVCQCYSRLRTRPAATAIGHHSGLSRVPLRRSDDNWLRCQHKHSGLSPEIPEFSANVC